MSCKLQSVSNPIPVYTYCLRLSLIFWTDIFTKSWGCWFFRLELWRTAQRFIEVISPNFKLSQISAKINVIYLTLHLQGNWEVIQGIHIQNFLYKTGNSKVSWPGDCWWRAGGVSGCLLCRSQTNKGRARNHRYRKGSNGNEWLYTCTAFWNCIWSLILFN